MALVLSCEVFITDQNRSPIYQNKKKTYRHMENLVRSPRCDSLSQHKSINRLLASTMQNIFSNKTVLTVLTSQTRCGTNGVGISFSNCSSSDHGSNSGWFEFLVAKKPRAFPPSPMMNPNS